MINLVYKFDLMQHLQTIFTHTANNIKIQLSLNANSNIKQT